MQFFTYYLEIGQDGCNVLHSLQVPIIISSAEIIDQLLLNLGILICQQNSDGQ